MTHLMCKRYMATVVLILDSEVFSQLRKDYQAYKSKFVQNIKFNATSPTLGNYHMIDELK